MKRQFCHANPEHMWQYMTKTWLCLACLETTTAENPCVRCGAEIGKAGSNLWCRDCLNGIAEERRVEDAKREREDAR